MLLLLLLLLRLPLLLLLLLLHFTSLDPLLFIHSAALLLSLLYVSPLPPYTMYGELLLYILMLVASLFSRFVLCAVSTAAAAAC